MKRSKMVEIIENVIVKAEGAWTYYEIACKILEEQEEAGMLPPRNNVEYNYYVHHDDCTGYVDDCYEWEPEDEA